MISRVAYPPVGREKITSTRTYFVRTDGSDSNSGTTNNSGGAFLTVQKGIDTIQALDNGGFDILISVGAGTFTGANTLKTFVGAGLYTIQGAGSSTIISTTSANCFSAGAVLGQWTLQDMKLTTTTSGNCLNITTGSLVNFSGIEFGACAGVAHILCQLATVAGSTSYTISGSCSGGFHVYSLQGGKVLLAGIPISVNGALSFFYFADSDRNSLIEYFGSSFKYNVTNKALTSNVATLTLAGTHTMAVGDSVVITSMSNSVFNGTYTLTAITGTTISYARTNANIASSAEAAGYCQDTTSQGNGPVTGPKFVVQNGSGIYTGNAGDNFLPGNAIGLKLTTSAGWYS